MALLELISGDFERESLRLRYSEAGRAYLRLTSVDGVVEDVFLERDVAAVAESGEGRVGEYLARWAERDGFVLRDLKVESSSAAMRRGDGRGECVFVVLLRDGRKFVARGAAEAASEIRLASLPADRRAKLARLDSARGGRNGAAGNGLLPRFVPGLIARLLPNR
ncbi:MAG: hypothetical protein OEL76_08845 [Siculibacillus sp.]|nr:hypothetical protein [Siculibacillus sp.]